MLDPEIEEKNIEYKRKLSLDIINTHRINTLITQMKWRINEGDGVAFYYLGVNDNGSIYEFKENEESETIETFKLLAMKGNIDIISIEKEFISNRYYFKATIKNKCVLKNEIRILILGPKNVGKTTFLSSLIYNLPDNGNGYLRNMLLNHKHELYSGTLNSVIVKTIPFSKNTDLSKNDYNITFIDTPASIINYKNYMLNLISVSNLVLILKTNQDDITNYCTILNNLNKNYKVINTKSDLYNYTTDGITLLKTLDKSFLDLKIDLNRDYDLKNNKTMILTKIYSGECLYLLICIQLSGKIKLHDHIYFDNDGDTGMIESIQYLKNSVDLIDKNIIFTCFVKTNKIIKNIKGKIFYSI
jgi:translation elongation factor EF-1alpha